MNDYTIMLMPINNKTGRGGTLPLQEDNRHYTFLGGEKMNIEKFEQNIGYKFKNKKLVQTALTHKSYANENKIQSNEKLEFLGDAILEFVTSK